MYNAHFVNMGSWSSFLPGWQSPRGSNLPEPIFLMGGIYLWWTTINVLAFAWSLKKLRVLLPNWSTLAHIPIAFCMIVFLDAILEIQIEEHTSELQSLMRISYAVFCLKKKNKNKNIKTKSKDKNLTTTNTNI